MSSEDEDKDVFDHLLEKGLWFSVIPSSQKKWNATAFSQHADDGRWYGFESKTHPTVEKAMDWLGKILKKKAQEKENV
tara:strand:- start:1651 stop:1884 length:234 start_codon:yes stop_codon:yes gene_type:complete